MEAVAVALLRESESRGDWQPKRHLELRHLKDLGHNVNIMTFRLYA